MLPKQAPSSLMMQRPRPVLLYLTVSRIFACPGSDHCSNCRTTCCRACCHNLPGKPHLVLLSGTLYLHPISPSHLAVQSAQNSYLCSYIQHNCRSLMIRCVVKQYVANCEESRVFCTCLRSLRCQHSSINLRWVVQHRSANSPVASVNSLLRART